MESKSGVCTPNTYVKSAKNRGEILVPGVYNISGSLLDFEMTTVPHLHEYWSSRDDQDMQLYLMKKMCAMNLLLHYHHAWSYKSDTRTNWKGNARHLCDFYWRMINLQKSLVDSISNFCSAQQWASPSCVLYCPAYLGKVSLQDYSAWSIGRLYCLIIVTRKAVISYRAKVSWIRTNRRQAEMFSVEETTAYTALSLLAD